MKLERNMRTHNYNEVEKWKNILSAKNERIMLSNMKYAIDSSIDIIQDQKNSCHLYEQGFFSY